MLFLTVALLTKTTVVSYGYTPDDNPKTELLKVDSVYRRAQNNFEQYVHRLYDDLNDESLQYELLAEGLTGYLNLKKSGQVRRPDILTLIDFSKPSNETRFYIVDLCQRKIVHKSLVAHGRNSGSLYAKYFSNETNSHQSSLGFYVTGSTYSGKYDLALRLEGKEHSNSRAMSRGVVMHAAKYATKEFLQKNGGVLGRSYGCPALPTEKFAQVVDWIKEGTVMYIYYPSHSYKRYSRYLNKHQYLEDFIRA